MGPLGIVLDPPCFDDLSRLLQRREPVLVETFWLLHSGDTAGEVTLAVDESGKGTENGPDLGCFEAPPDFASSLPCAVGTPPLLKIGSECQHVERLSVIKSKLSIS